MEKQNANREEIKSFLRLVKIVFLPIGGVVFDIICDVLQRCIVADDVFVIIRAHTQVRPIQNVRQKRNVKFPKTVNPAIGMKPI